jgi:hypothetical protein
MVGQLSLNLYFGQMPPMTPQWQYAFIGTSEATNWPRIGYAGFDMRATFNADRTFKVSEVPWTPIGKSQALKLAKNPQSNINMAIHSGGAWPFQFVGPASAEFTPSWPHTNEVVGKWKNVNVRGGPFINNSVSVVARQMRLTVLNITYLDQAERRDDKGVPARLMTCLAVSTLGGRILGNLEVPADGLWSDVAKVFQQTFDIRDADVKWYTFVPEGVITDNSLYMSLKKDLCKKLKDIFPNCSQHGKRATSSDGDELRSSKCARQGHTSLCSAKHPPDSLVQ